MKRLIVGISGASGVIYGIRLLQILKDLPNIETHLIISQTAQKILSLETNFSLYDVEKLANVVYDYHDVSASISSGSFQTIGMIIMPCSIKTLSGIVNSYTDNLLIRAADVSLKEKRRLLLGIRETPLHIGHLHLMIMAAKLNAIIMPPIPAFYYQPTQIIEIINQTINRVLDQFDLSLPYDLFKRWQNI